MSDELSEILKDASDEQRDAALKLVKNACAGDSWQRKAMVEASDAILIVGTNARRMMLQTIRGHRIGAERYGGRDWPEDVDWIDEAQQEGRDLHNYVERRLLSNLEERRLLRKAESSNIKTRELLIELKDQMKAVQATEGAAE